MSLPLPGGDSPITQRDLQTAVATATLAQQVSEVIRDVAALGARMDKDMSSMNGRLDQHDARHDQEKRAKSAERKSDRRFRITTTIAAFVAFCALGALLVDISSRVH